MAYCGAVSCLDWSTSSRVFFWATSSSQLSMRVLPLCTAHETPDRVSFSTTRSPLERNTRTAFPGTWVRSEGVPAPDAEQLRQVAPALHAAYVQSPTVTGAAAAPDATEYACEAGPPSSGTRMSPRVVPIHTAFPVAAGCWTTGSSPFRSTRERSTVRP